MLRRVTRILLAAACLGLVAQQSNVGGLLLGDPCPTQCQEDTAPHQCPPSCWGCACVGTGTPLSLPPIAPAAVQAAVADVERDETHPAADPRVDAIFHVPKPILG